MEPREHGLAVIGKKKQKKQRLVYLHQDPTRPKEFLEKEKEKSRNVAICLPTQPNRKIVFPFWHYVNYLANFKRMSWPKI